MWLPERSIFQVGKTKQKLKSLGTGACLKNSKKSKEKNLFESEWTWGKLRENEIGVMREGFI